MKYSRIRLVLLFCACTLIIPKIAYSQVRLPCLISDGMVLQRNTSVIIWGWATVGEKVAVDFLDNSYNTISDKDGKWAVSLPEMDAGGPYRMDIIANNQITLQNIMVGDVWVCSGQSNMVLPMERVRDRYEAAIASSENPAIRQFLVPTKYDFNTPQGDVPSGSWEVANPEHILRFSAAGYFFAKTLFERYQVPIGLINASVGGSPAEAWLSDDALQAFPRHLETVAKYKDTAYVNQILAEDNAISEAWYKRARQRDEGLADGEQPWFDPSYDASTWQTMPVPGYWEDEGLGAVNGVVWFRKKINVPDSMTGKPAKLLLGRIVDSDSVYINGKFVGTVSYQYPPRRYIIPPGVLQSDENIIVVRVINNAGRGGFIEDKPYELNAGGETIDLKGEWQYKLGAVMDPLPAPTFVRWQPLGLFNGMIAPLLKYRMKGVIWYQGESNTDEPSEYRKLFPALITDWRQKWEQGNFPFLYVQLANYMQSNPQPSESNWAELREAQLKTLSVTKNTAMAVTIDIGEWNDIHPLNKEDVGKRLALAAQNIAYGDKGIVYSGPIYQSMKIKEKRATLTFTHIGGGLVAKGDSRLNHFVIAGADKVFMWAEAKIKGNKVVVWNNAIEKPVVVRYAWADNPEGANLYNEEGLPASPFRTDE